MSITAIVLGLINIALVVVLLLLLGAIVLWFLRWLNFPPPDNVQKLYLAFVALVALYMLAAMILGAPTIRVIGGTPKDQGRVIGGWIPPVPDIIRSER